jgi:penicillin-binding protein 1A
MAELPGWQAAGKTGTSQDWRDAWFVGYTSYLIAAVWLGNDEGSPTRRVSGGNLPVEIWSRFMKAAHDGVPVAALPLGAWRSAEARNPPSLPPFDLNGAQAPAPPPGGRGGGAPTPSAAPSASSMRPTNLTPPRGGEAPAGGSAPVPPAFIPNPGRGRASGETGLIGRLFGAL